MFNNPMMYNNSFTRGGLFSGLRGLNWRGVLANFKETLGIINQTIPIIYQVKPIISNAKTMFRLSNAIRNSDDNTDNNSNNNSNDNNLVQNKNTDIYDNKPVFYI